MDCGTKHALLAWHNENLMFNMDRYSPGLFFWGEVDGTGFRTAPKEPSQVTIQLGQYGVLQKH